jgi:steroid 5-alpha reductase family enzyme
MLLFSWDPYNFILALLIILITQVVFFAFAAYFKTDKVTDLSYGLSFVATAGALLIANKIYSFWQMLLVLLIAVWGIRLAGFLFIRVLKLKKDYRFDGIRENVVKFGRFWLLQAVSIWLIMLPSIAALGSKTSLSLNLAMYLGLSILAIGFIIEAVADYQKYQYKNLKNKPHEWVSSGLWHYSRHPNYFGEMLCWWGIFIFVSPILSNLLWLTLIGPFYITALLLFVSGIPPLEKKNNERYTGNKDYLDYKAKTSLLIPLPTKK